MAAATTAIGNPARNALNQRLRKSLPSPVLIEVIAKVIMRLMPKPIIAINKTSEYFLEIIISLRNLPIHQMLNHYLNFYQIN